MKKVQDHTFSDDDSDLSSQLIESIQKNEDYFEELARKGLRESRDEVFRCTCVEYLDYFSLINEYDLLLALADKEDIVLIQGITAAESFESENVNLKLLELTKQSTDEFIVAWSVVTLGLKSKEVVNDIKKIRNNWSESELIQCSVEFYMAANKVCGNSSFRFFRYLDSESHLVRGMVLNLSDRFVHCEISKRLRELLLNHKKNEPMQSLKELVDIKLESFLN